MQGLIFTSRRPGGPSQNVAFTSTSGCVANPLPAGAASVTIYTTVAAFVKVALGASSITATSSDIPIPANTPISILVPRRHESNAATEVNAYVAAVGTTITSAGTMYVQPNAD